MTDDDIKRARALVSDLQRSSLFQTRLAGDTIAALLAERDALARDAARYRWLRNERTTTEYRNGTPWATSVTMNGIGPPLRRNLFLFMLDAAIDAAMGASDE